MNVKSEIDVMSASEQSQEGISMPETIDPPPGPEQPDPTGGQQGDDHPYIAQMEDGGNPLGYTMDNPNRTREGNVTRKEVLANLLVHFWHGYRKVRDTLTDLRDAVQAGEQERARSALQQVRGFLGPHFRYEEAAIFPVLRERLGNARVRRLQKRHEKAVKWVRSLSSLLDDDLEDGIRADRAEAHVQELLLLVTATAGQTLLIETFSLDALKTILDEREQALVDGIDLLEWADAEREQPGSHGGSDHPEKSSP